MQIELADIVKLYNRIDELEKRVVQLEERLNMQQKKIKISTSAPGKLWI